MDGHVTCPHCGQSATTVKCSHCDGPIPAPETAAVSAVAAVAVDRRGRRPWLAVAVACAGLLAGGVVVLVVLLATSRDDRAGPDEVEDMPVAVQRQARLADQRMMSRNKLHMLGIALHNYHDVHGTFPPAHVQVEGGPAMASFHTMLLPYVDEAVVFSAYNFDRPWDGAVNSTVGMTRIGQYLMPGVDESTTARGFAVTHYLGVLVGDPTKPSSVFGRNSRIRVRDVRDGASNTIIMAEAATEAPAWAGPNALRDVTRGIGQPGGFGRPDGDGALFLFADGQVRLLSSKTDPKVLQALTTYQGGEIIDDEKF